MGVVLARPMVLIPYLLRLADVINFKKNYFSSLVRHLNPIHVEKKTFPFAHTIKTRKSLHSEVGTCGLSVRSLVGFWAGLSWLVLIYCERKALLTG